jgi:FKBP-type peptidyl-prolyl cis-trans isomerase FklB
MMEHHEQAPEGAGSQMPMTMPRWPIKILSSLLLSAACCAAHTQGTKPAGEAPDGVATTNGAAAAKAAPAPDARSAKAAASYSLGLSFSSQWHEGGLDGALSVDDLLRGIRAGLGGTALTPDDRQRAGALLKEAYSAWAGRNQAAADEFLAHNAKQAGVTTTASGLQYLVLHKGDPNAPAVAPGDNVTVQYRGRLMSGTEFDSSFRRGKPAIIRPNDVIAGWREALALMRPGAEWRLFIPPNLAYALTPPPAIPPNALLIFEVSMIGVEPAATPHAAAPASTPAPASVSATP